MAHIRLHSVAHGQVLRETKKCHLKRERRKVRECGRLREKGRELEGLAWYRLGVMLYKCLTWQVLRSASHMCSTSHPCPPVTTPLPWGSVTTQKACLTSPSGHVCTGCYNIPFHFQCSRLHHNIKCHSHCHGNHNKCMYIYVHEHMYLL